MKKNLIIASLIAAGLALWLISGLFVEAPERLPGASDTVLQESSHRTMRVRVAEYHAQQRTLTHILRGKTASKRQAQVSAETTGRVVARPVERGDSVAAGDLLCELALDEREVAVAEARASLEHAAIEYRGAKELHNKDLLSEIGIADLAAKLAAAEANLERQKLNLQRRFIKAPFDGVVETLHMDVGDLAAQGSPCATLLGMDPMLISANVSERDIGFIELGQSVTARTSTDQQLQGTVTFVGRQSDPTTRTYPVEITVPNPDLQLRAGLTTVVSVASETVLAHRISPALLTLNDAGVMGLRAVDDRNHVAFHPVSIVEDSAEGAWVTGLPSIVNLITVGQEFVSAGELVEVERASAVTASRL